MPTTITAAAVHTAEQREVIRILWYACMQLSDCLTDKQDNLNKTDSLVDLYAYIHVSWVQSVEKWNKYL